MMRSDRGTQPPETINPAETWISVVMPVFNGERYVAGAIESILAQTHPRFEFIIINDGSTDGTARILDRYAQHDSRIRVYHQENIDQPATLNRALQLARYDWVAIIDHDDLSQPNRLERQLQMIAAHPDVRAVGSYAILIDADGNHLRRRARGVTTETEFQVVQAENGWVSLIHPSVMMHRPTVLALGGYDPAFGPSADTELWSRLSDEHLILVVPELLVLYRIHSGSMSATRFFEQRRALRWIRARQIARRQGLPIPARDEFLRSERGRLGIGRWAARRRLLIQYLRYHRQIAIQEQRLVRQTVCGACMILINPEKYVPRTIKRVIVGNSRSPG